MNKRPGYASTFIIECSINPQINVEQVKRDKMLGNFYIRILYLIQKVIFYIYRVIKFQLINLMHHLEFSNPLFIVHVINY